MTDNQDQKPKPATREILDPVRRDLVERVAALHKRGLLPGHDSGDASLEATAIEQGAVTIECYGCGKEVLEFWKWRATCRADPNCTLEIVRCFACDADGKVTAGVLDAHHREKHDDLLVACSQCGQKELRLRELWCPETGCDKPFARCRERCDPTGDVTRGLLAAHLATHRSAP